MALKPVNVGPFQNIINVGWAQNGGGIPITWEIRGKVGGNLTITEFPWAPSEIINLSDTGTVRQVDGQGRTIFEKLATVLEPQESGPPNKYGKAVIYLKAAKPYVTAGELKFKINRPEVGGFETTSSAISYWIWAVDFFPSFEENLANPFTTGDPFNAPFGIMTIPAAFGTEAEADAYIAAFLAPTLGLHVEPPGTPVIHFVGGRIKVEMDSYDKLALFPFGNPHGNTALWNTDLAKSFNQFNDNSPGSSPKPAQVYQYKMKYNDYIITRTP